MSQIINALAIGSFAAHLNGALPAWRAGKIGDIDLIGDEDMAHMLTTLYGGTLAMVTDSSGIVKHPLGLRFDVDFRAALVDMARGWSDQKTIWLAGQQLTLWVARPALVYAIRLVTAPFVPSYIEKVSRDIADYEAQGLIMDDDLEALAKLFIAPQFSTKGTNQ